MDTQKVTYYSEISMMMFGFGDSHKPNPDTVRLVESIVLNQLRLIIQEALKYSNGKILKGQELIFLMRKNKYKMWRFIKYLQMKSIKKKVDAKETETIDLCEPPQHELMSFIEKIDETGELSNFTDFDEVKHERLIRADRISMSLDEEQYLKFSKARCVSFLTNKNGMYGKFDKLKLWVDPKKEVTFHNSATDVLMYYAFETVAQLIDYAFLVRLDMRRTGDPLSNLSGLYYNAAMFNGEHRFSGSNPDYSRVYNGQLPFTPNEIKEVMRRVHSSQVGRLMLGTKIPQTHYILAI